KRISDPGAAPAPAFYAGYAGGVSPRRACADARHRPSSDGGFLRPAEKYPVRLSESLFRRSPGAIFGVFLGHHALYQRVDYFAVVDCRLSLPGEVVERR